MGKRESTVELRELGGALYSSSQLCGTVACDKTILIVLTGICRGREGFCEGQRRRGAIVQYDHAQIRMLTLHNVTTRFRKYPLYIIPRRGTIMIQVL